MGTSITRRRFVGGVVGVGAAALVAAGCGDDDSETTGSAEGDGQATDSGDGATETQDQTKLITAGRETMIDSLNEYAAPVLAEQGIALELAGFGMDQLQTKVLQAAATGTYIADLVQVAANDGGDVMGAGFLAEVPSAIKDEIAWDDIIPLYQRLTSWNGTNNAVIFDGDKHMQAFRGDLAEDPTHQQAFEAQFGYPLPVAGAETWDQRRDLGKYFSEVDWRGDGAGVGLVDMTDRNGFGWYSFLSRAASTVKHPELSGAIFHPDTMEPLIANDGFVRVLEEWKEEVLTYGPEGGENMDIGTAFNTFQTGFSFSFVNWCGSNQVNTEFVSYDLPDGETRGPEVVRFSMAPGSTEVWNYETGTFDTMSEVSRSPFIANGGWTMGVPANSKQPDAAWRAIAAIASPEVSLQLVTQGTGVEPSRFSHVESIDPWVNSPVPMSEKTAQTYIAAEKDSMSHPNLLMDLRIPGFSQYKDALELAISKALSGQASAGDALQEAAEAFGGITERLGGPEVQGDLYRQAIA